LGTKMPERGAFLEKAVKFGFRSGKMTNLIRVKTLTRNTFCRSRKGMMFLILFREKEL